MKHVFKATLFGAFLAGSLLSPMAASAEPSTTNTPTLIAVNNFDESEFDWQTRANIAIDEIRDQFPDDFADSVLGDGSFVLRFRDQVPGGAADILSGVGVPYEVVAGTGFSETELQAASVELHDTVRDLVGPDVSFVTAAVAGSNQFEVTIDPALDQTARRSSPVPTSEEIQTSLQETVAQVSAGIFTTAVTIEEGAGLVEQGYGQAGGNWLRAANFEACTSAFVVKKVGGSDLGVLTAGHCQNSMQQMSTNGNYWFDFRAEHNGPRGDIQWMRSPVMMDPWFHQSNGVGSPVRAVATAGPGTSICHYGITTNKSCGWVVSITATAQAGGVTHYNMSSAEGPQLRADFGDSGGPWFSGTTAYGIHSGANNNLSYFTSVKRAQSEFGVAVCLEQGC